MPRSNRPWINRHIQSAKFCREQNKTAKSLVDCRLSALQQQGRCQYPKSTGEKDGFRSGILSYMYVQGREFKHYI